jgi:hypothetical protein
MNESYGCGSFRESSFDEIWNGGPMRKMRAALLKDEAFPHCRSCYEADTQGMDSMRAYSLRNFAAEFDRVNQTSDDGATTAKDLRYLNLRFSNVCNFRCRTCYARNSTSWASDAAELGHLGRGQGSGTLSLRDSGAAFNLWLAETLPHVERIYFAGGEPLLHADHYVVLEKLIELGKTDVVLEYNTNFSVLRYKRWDALALWKHFKKLRVLVSFDGVGPQGELIRKGLNWARTEKRLMVLRRLMPNIDFKLNPTVSVMNVFHLTVALDRWLKLKIIEQRGDLDFNILEEPRYLSINILTHEERERLRLHYSQYLEGLKDRVPKPEVFESISELLHWVLDSFSDEVLTEERQVFREYTLSLDRLRNERFTDLFPEHKDLVGSPA